MAMSSFINPTLFNFTALSFILILVFFLFKNGKLQQKKYHPVAGTVFDVLLNFNRLHDFMADLANKHRTYRILGPFRREICTTDPAIVEYILKTNFENYGKGGYVYGLLRDLLGDGIFTVDGEKWRQQRKISSFEFSTRVLRDFSSVIFRKNAAKLAVILSEAAVDNRIVDMQDLFMKSTMDSIFKVAFGVELDCMRGSSEEGRVFSKAFEEASALTLWRYVDVLWSIKKFLNIGSEAKLKKNLGIINSFVLKVIRSKMEEINNAKDNHLMRKDEILQREDILSRFLSANEMDEKYLRDIILNFVIAGKDTTAVTLSWFISALCRYSRVQDMVATEVNKLVDLGDVADFTEFALRLNDETLEKMHYLHATITETLRLYPAVPGDMKICFSDDTFPDGFSIQKGDSVAYQPYAMGRMKFLWGEDAEEFRPERWLDQDGLFRPESPFKFTAFQAGPRICLGKEFAYRQMKIFTALLVGCFEFKLADQKNAVNYRTMINLTIDGGLPVMVSPRRRS